MASCCETKTRCCSSEKRAATYVPVSARNTLAFSPELCIGCGLCVAVCPHAVFALASGKGSRVVSVVHPDACMECGACQLNCPTAALQVDPGVGCAAAMIHAALTGQKEACCC
jgi:NAD-dependent dihydropyrimidine dehydrogenase PreA subunit